ncbi:unnamed protein product [Arabis nemorensis]|uniref:Uncharacterized protein n=1 Tax=Arabis nemorensis TaxID=586526 RepID=A0A565AR17_9BRAS|nr:unnamed protein product [Arabis nemorensis]
MRNDPNQFDPLLLHFGIKPDDYFGNGCGLRSTLSFDMFHPDQRNIYIQGLVASREIALGEYFSRRVYRLRIL